LNEAPPAEPRVEVILLSRNSSDTGCRIFNSIEHYGLSIARAAFTGGAPTAPYVASFGAQLFLSANPESVARALHDGIAAATILPSKAPQATSDQLRIAFDGDAVLFDDEAERISESGGIDADFEHVFDRVALPVLRQFAPDLILVSAGFDAHERDPLATMRATEAGFAAMTMALRRVADETCHGRLALITEGGYDLKALDASLEAVVETLAGRSAPPTWPAATTASGRGRASADAAVRALGAHWKLQ
jgi:5'-nucleotidase